jgi:hemoglobin
LAISRTIPEGLRFFVGLSTDSRNKVRQHVVDFLCASGGPCKYTGRDRKTAHTGLNITDSDWTSMGKYLVGTLDNFKVPEKENNEVLIALSGSQGGTASADDVTAGQFLGLGPPLRQM